MFLFFIASHYRNSGVTLLSATVELPWRTPVCSSWKGAYWRHSSWCTGAPWMWTRRRTKIAAWHAAEQRIITKQMLAKACIETLEFVKPARMCWTMIWVLWTKKRTQCVALTDAGFTVAKQFLIFRRASQRLYFWWESDFNRAAGIAMGRESLPVARHWCWCSAACVSPDRARRVCRNVVSAGSCAVAMQPWKPATGCIRFLCSPSSCIRPIILSPQLEIPNLG